MDGRMSVMSVLVLLGLAGCVTTTEQKTVVRTDTDPAANARQEPKKPAPPRLLVAIGEMKESEADAAKDNPEQQARLRDEARQAFQAALKAEPDNLPAALGVAHVYASMGDYERARETYKKALARHPRDVNIWFELGMMHDRKKEWAEGIKCFRKALEIDPENQRGLKALGFTLARSGQIEQSVACLTRAMGSAAMAHYNIALMLLHLSEQEPADRAPREALARQHLQRAMQENPNCDRARELLASLEAPAPAQGAIQIRFADPGH